MAELHDLVAEDARAGRDKAIDECRAPEDGGERGLGEVEVLCRRDDPGLEGGVEDRRGDPAEKATE